MVVCSRVCVCAGCVCVQVVVCSRALESVVNTRACLSPLRAPEQTQIRPEGRAHREVWSCDRMCVYLCVCVCVCVWYVCVYVCTCVCTCVCVWYTEAWSCDRMLLHFTGSIFVL